MALAAQLVGAKARNYEDIDAAPEEEKPRGITINTAHV